MWFPLLLSVAVALYNNVVNRWQLFHGPMYVPVNLAFAGALALTVATRLGESRSELGFSADRADVILPLVAIAMFAVGAFAFARSPHGHLITDKRVVGQHGAALAFYILVRIPLGTAVAEEVIFRGALLAAWRGAGASTVVAAVGASVAFGLWHVAPTIIAIRVNDPGASRRKVRSTVIGAIALTTAAGLGFSWLRVVSGSLLGPILIHAGINSIGALAAVTAARRRRMPPLDSEN